MKKLVSLGLSLIMATIMVTSGLAATPAVARAPGDECNSCGMGHMDVESTDSGPWRITLVQTCAHEGHPYEDLYRERTIYQHLVCSHCGNGYTLTYIEEELFCGYTKEPV